MKVIDCDVVFNGIFGVIRQLYNGISLKEEK